MATSKLPSSLLCLSFFLLLCFLCTNAAAAVSNSTKSKSAAMAAEFLNAHNKVRAQHGLPQLKWSSRLATFAKWYANQRREDCRLIHSSGDLGENIFWGKGKRWTPAQAVALWAAEKSDYDYKRNVCIGNRECLHYTQLVWKTTTSVGCAKVLCRSGDSFITCNYYPHGNIIGDLELKKTISIGYEKDNLYYFGDMGA